MPLPAGWTVTIADFHRVPDGGGHYGVLVAFSLTGPAGTGALFQTIVPPSSVFICESEQTPKQCILLAAWQQVRGFAAALIGLSPLTTSPPDPVIGTVFSPP